MKQQKKFLEKCFLGLKKHKALPGGKDPALLAEGLFWMLQGTEVQILFVQNNEVEEDFIKMLHKTIKDFFKII
jgi:hypothetical protein